MSSFRPPQEYVSEKPVVVLIEDQSLHIRIVYEALGETCRVLQARTGLKGVELVQGTKPDLVLLDVGLPDIDGFEVCRRLKSDILTAEIPVMFITAQAHSEQEALCLDMGAVDFVAKPINPIVLTARTKTHLLRAQNLREIQRQRARLRLVASVFTHTRDAVAICNGPEKIVEANKAFIEIFGDPLQSSSNARITDKIEGFEEGILRDVLDTIEVQGFYNSDIKLRVHAGDEHVFSLSALKVLSPSEELASFVYIFNDVSEARRYQARLERLANFDSLTNCANRVLLTKKLQEAIENFELTGTRFALIYIDLDDFKVINDKFGHAAGDSILQETANRLLSASRSSDLVARLGGDEFVILLAQSAGADTVSGLSSRISRVFESPIVVDGEPISVSASIGVTRFPQDGNDPDKLLRDADQAMYADKRERKSSASSRITGHDRFTETKPDDEILRGLREGEFELVYTPKVDMLTGEVLSFDASLQWMHPTRGLLLMRDFLNLTHDVSLARELAIYCLHEAVTYVEELKQEGNETNVVISVDPRVFADFDFRKCVTDIRKGRYAEIINNLRMEIRASRL